MSGAGRPLARFGLWLLALALGFGVGVAVATLVTALPASASDDGNDTIAVFWGLVAWALSGIVAVWWFARPRPRARRWLFVGIPVVLAVAFVAATMAPGVILAFPLVWFAAFWAAILPHEPSATDA